MKAVNQCIGRVIRHRGDWAAILLVDQRWNSDQSAGKALECPHLLLNSICMQAVVPPRHLSPHLNICNKTIPW